MKYTATADPKVKSWDRIRFMANVDDPRPIIWPPLGPYWISGSGFDFSVVVAYVPHEFSDEGLKKYWPEAKEIDRMQTDIPIHYSDRFAKPDWWIE